MPLNKTTAPSQEKQVVPTISSDQTRYQAFLPLSASPGLISRLTSCLFTPKQQSLDEEMMSPMVGTSYTHTKR